MIIQPNNDNTAPPALNIATHNTRSFTLPHKQQILYNLYNIHHLDIIAIQETNFKYKSNLCSLKPICSDKFVPFFNIDPSSQIMGFGVGFLVKKHLADHVFCYSSFYHQLFFLDFHFKNKSKLHIINIYVSRSDVQLRRNTYKKAINL